VPLKDLFVIGRSGAQHRGTLLHRLIDGTSSHTLCGRDISEWSRAYVQRAIPEILCLRCGGA